MIYQCFCQTLLHVLLATKLWKYNVSIVMWAGQKRASAWWVHHLGCLGVAPSSISVAWMHLCHRQSLRRKMLLTCFSASMEPAMKTRYLVTVWCVWLTVSLLTALHKAVNCTWLLCCYRQMCSATHLWLLINYLSIYKIYWLYLRLE